MNPRVMFPLFSIVMAMLLLGGDTNAEALDFGISIGGDYHRPRVGRVVRYRTADPVYHTWYPEYRTTRRYPVVYRSSSYYGYDRRYYTPYQYRTRSAEFNVWFGSDGRRHHERRSYRR